MKIVHVMNWYIPEMGYQENFLPAEQQKLGHEVYIITSDRLPLHTGFENIVGKVINNRIIGSGVSRENDVTIFRLPTIFEIRDGGIIAFSGLNKKLFELKPDVVHAHGPYNVGTLFSILYCRKMGCKIFIDDHSNFQNYHINSVLKSAYINFIKLFYLFWGSGVSGWMPIDEPAKAILMDNLKITPEKINIVPLGISTHRFFQSFEIRNSTREELSVRDDENLIITTGKFGESKDIDVLIKAFANVLRQKNNVRLLIIGNGPSVYMENLHKIIKENEIENSVIFKDFVKNQDLPKYYNAADIGVWPGTPTITAVESLATGLSIILPEDDLCYKNIFNHKAALGFERKKIESLTREIIKLMDDAEKREKLEENALYLAINQLSWEKIAE